MNMKNSIITLLKQEIHLHLDILLNTRNDSLLKDLYGFQALNYGYAMHRIHFSDEAGKKSITGMPFNAILTVSE